MSASSVAFDVPALLDDYTSWLRKSSAVERVGEWNEVTLPFLDCSGDDLVFYVRIDRSNSVAFTDDGYTFATLNHKGVSITEKRLERMQCLARRYGVSITNKGEVTLDAEDSYANALNRYAQALLSLNSMTEVSRRHVAEYFADDVAKVLESCNVYCTANVIIRGVSGYEHSFDFLFQRSAKYPTRFCHAPNKFDKTAVRDIMWSWQDTCKAKEREGSKLFVIGDDRDHPLQTAALEAFENYGVEVIPFSNLEERAYLLRAV